MNTCNTCLSFLMPACYSEDAALQIQIERIASAWNKATLLALKFLFSCLIPLYYYRSWNDPDDFPKYLMALPILFDRSVTLFCIYHEKQVICAIIALQRLYDPQRGHCGHFFSTYSLLSISPTKEQLLLQMRTINQADGERYEAIWNTRLPDLQRNYALWHILCCTLSHVTECIATILFVCTPRKQERGMDTVQKIWILLVLVCLNITRVFECLMARNYSQFAGTVYAELRELPAG